MEITPCQPSTDCTRSPEPERIRTNTQVAVKELPEPCVIIGDMAEESRQPIPRMSCVKPYTPRRLKEILIDSEILYRINSPTRNKQIKLAVTYYQGTIRDSAPIPELYYGLAVLLYSLHQYEQAHAALTDAIRLQPGYAEAHAWLGLTCIALGAHEEGDHHLRMAIALKPHDPEAWGRLSLSLARQGHMEAAIAGFRHSLRLDPHGIGLRIHLERLLRRQRGEENHER